LDRVRDRVCDELITIKIAIDRFQDPNFKYAIGFDLAQSLKSFLQFLTDKKDPNKIPLDRVQTTFMCDFLKLIREVVIAKHCQLPLFKNFL
jgi:hypothetical protein